MLNIPRRVVYFEILYVVTGFYPAARKCSMDLRIYVSVTI